MLVVSATVGNIYSDDKLAETWQRAIDDGTTDRLCISRSDMQKARMKRKTESGTDIGIVFERGTHLHHGDIIDVKGTLIVVEQLPEKVATITLDGVGRQAVDNATLVGHAIGNRHRAISVANGMISFPIQNESELEVFERLLPAGLKLKVTTQVFVPSGDAHQHE